MNSWRLFVAASILVSMGCSSSATSPTPTPPPFTKLYVTNFQTSGNGLMIYAPPFSAALAPSVTVPASVASGLQSPGGLAVDSTGKVYVINFSTTSITIYNQPITAASTPSVTIVLPASSNPYNLTL